MYIHVHCTCGLLIYYPCMYTLQGANILLTDDGDVKLGMDQSVYIHTHAHMHIRT